MLYTNQDVASTLCQIKDAGLISSNQNLQWFPKEMNCDGTRRRPYIISIDGNIGAGKSTFIDKLQKIYDTGTLEEKCATFGKFANEKILFMKEPVALWTSIRDPVTGESILEMFYKNPQKYSFAFQVMVYNTHLDAFRRILRENPDCTLLFCERSIDAGRHIFTNMLHDDGMIDDVSFQVYNQLFDNTSGEVVIDAIMLLSVSPEVCMQHVEKRAREGESTISLEYLAKCDKYYKKWLL